MYKFKSYMMAMLAVGSMAFLTSCGDDEEVKPAPAIALTGTHTADANLAAGSPINTTATITSNGGSNIMAYSVTVLYDDAIEQVVDVAADINEPNKTVIISRNARSAAGTEKYTITATNKDGQTASKSFTITTTGAAAMRSYTAVLGNQAANEGSSFASANGTVYNLADAKANSGLIDWMHYHSVPGSGTLAANGATLVAPSNVEAEAAFAGANALSTWANRNETKFKTGFTTADFTSADNSAALAAAWDNSTAAETDMVKNLNSSTNSVVAFRTEDGKHGLIQITNVTAPTSSNNKSTISMNVKVQ